MAAQAPAEQGQLDASPALFTALAAINAAGYDAGIDSPSNSPVREMVRREIAAKKPPCLPELRTFFATHKQPDPVTELRQYVSFGLSVEGPPGFAYRYRTNELSPDVVALDGFDALMRKFYKEADVEALWRKAQPAFEQMIERYHTPAVNALIQVNAYMRASSGPALGSRFQVYVDLLGAPNQVQTHSYKNDYFVVVTPSAAPQVDQIRHAYLHYVLDVLGVRYAEELNKKRGLLDFAQPAPLLDAQYKADFPLLATECLVKAVEGRLALATQRPAMAEQALKEGYILTPAFAELLPAYEKQEQSMRFYYPDLVKAIDLKREDQRLDNFQFLASRPTPEVRPVELPVPPPPLTGARKALRDAQQSYAIHEMDKAQAAYERALKETEEKPLQAKAYYGLGLIAGNRENLELAQQCFEKALASSPDAETQAWVHVWLGRLAETSGQRDQAAQHYKSALEVPGIPARARAAAQKGLDDSARKSKPRP